MTTKVVFRLLDARNGLLGWAEQVLVPKSDGCLWSREPVVIVPDVAGLPSVVSMHWCDVNVETRVPWTSGPVPAGRPIAVFAANQVVLVIGPMPGPLPAVTVGKPILVAVPAGGMGTRGLP